MTTAREPATASRRSRPAAGPATRTRAARAPLARGGAGDRPTRRPGRPTELTLVRTGARRLPAEPEAWERRRRPAPTRAHRRTRRADRRRLHAAPAPGRRLVAILVVLLLVFAAIGVRLVDVQARNRAYYRGLGIDQRVHSVEIPAERGSIFDRNGNDLAVSVSRSSVWADPAVVRDPVAAASALAPVLGVDAAALTEDLAQEDRRFVYLARKVDNDVAQRIKALDVVGVGFLPETKRYYPAGDLAAPLLGFVGIDNDGLAGIESGRDRLLSGRTGTMDVERDPQGRELPDGQRRVIEPKAGNDLLLTIDQPLQYEVERILVAEVDRARAKGGTAVVADVRTGDVLAMATIEGATKDVPARPAPAGTPNRPLTDVFEPGSTNKVVTIAAALEAGVVGPDTVLAVPNQILVDDQEFEDVHTHGPELSVADIVRLSSNVGTIKIAEMLGRERFDEALRAFGFGRGTGLDYPGEAPGILLPLEEYNATSLASMPVGNGIAVTAMQMLDVYLTIANAGVAREPRLVAATVDAEGRRHEEPLGATRRVVSESTARTMTTLLEAVVSDGTGTRAQVDGYRVAGKTGTARKPPYEKPPYRYVASFAGFAPAESPRLAAIVVLDEPKVDTSGGTVAAPVFAKIMQYALAIDRVPVTP